MGITRERYEEERRAAVTLPALCLPAPEPDFEEQERREINARSAEQRIIKSGREAWHAIGRAESFDAWKAIGAALSVGKQYALRVTGANEPWGRNYSHTFSKWMRDHGFGGMAKSVRSVAIELHENLQQIEQFRAGLPERQRRRLVHPLSNVRRWRKAAANGNGYHCAEDLKRDAVAAWRKFVSCVAMLPEHEAAPLWAMVHEARPV